MKTKFKKALNNIFNIFLIFLILLTNTFVPEVFAEEINLEELVDENGIIATVTNTSNVERNGKLEINIEFTIDQKKYDEAKKSGEWFFDLEEFIKENPISSIENKSGDLIDGSISRGNYRIENNKVYFTINEDWLQNNSYNLKGHFSITAYLNLDEIGPKNSVELKLPSNKTVEIFFKPIASEATKGITTEENTYYSQWPASELYVHRTNEDEFYLYYEDKFKCDVDLSLDDNENFTYTNSLSNNQEVDINSFTLNGESISEEYIEVDKSNNTVTINLEDLIKDEKVSKDQYVIIKYRTKVESEHFGETGESEATWKWNKESIDVTAVSNKTTFSFYEYFEKIPLNKEMRVNEDERYIDYTITVGDGENNLAGGEIIDEMTDVQNLFGDITIELAEGTKNELEDEFSIDKLKEYIVEKWNDDKEYDKLSKTPVFNLSFPEDGNYYGPYKITYRTKLTNAIPELNGDIYVENYIQYIDKEEKQRNNEFGIGENIKFVSEFSRRFNKEFHKIDTENHLLYWRVPIYVEKDECLKNVTVRDYNFIYGLPYAWGGINQETKHDLQIKSENIKIYTLKESYKNEYINQNFENVEEDASKNISEEIIVEGLLKKYNPDEIFEQKDIHFDFDKETNTIKFDKLESTIYIVIPTYYAENIEDTKETWLFNNSAELKINDKVIGQALASHNYKNAEDYVLLRKDVEFQRNGVYKWTVLVNEGKENFVPDYIPYFYDLLPEGMILTDEKGELPTAIDWKDNENYYNIPIYIVPEGTDSKGNSWYEYNKYTKTIKSKEILKEIPRISLISDENWNQTAGINGVTYTITYYTKLTDEEYAKRLKVPFNDEISYLNRAYLYNGETKDSELKAQAEREAKFDLPAVQKSALTKVNPDEDIVDYEIIVNKDKAILNNGDNLILKDTIADGADLILNSINVLDENDKKLENVKIGYNSKTRILQIIIPDKEMVKIKYKLKILGDGNQAVTNSVDLIGTKTWNDTINTNYYISKHSGGIFADTTLISLHKIDEEDISVEMNGAVFELTSETQGVVGRYTVNKGYLKFENLLPNELYTWQEVIAPEGYELDDTKYYFIVYENAVDNNVVSANKKQALELKDKLEKEKNIEIDVLLSGYELTVSNKRIVSEETNQEEPKPEEQKPQEPKPQEQNPQEQKPQNQNTEIQKTEEPNIENLKIEEKKQEEQNVEALKEEAIIQQQVEMQKQIVSEGIKTGDGVVIYLILNILSVSILIFVIKKKKND